MALARCIFIAILLLGLSARAQLHAPPAGATQLGLAGAAVAGRPAPTALWHNPSQLVGSASGGVASLGIQHEQRSLLPSEKNSDEDYATQLGKDAAEPGLSPAVVLSQALWSNRLWTAFGYRQRLRHRSHFMRSSAQFVAAAQEQPLHDPVRYLGSELRVTDHELCLAGAVQIFNRIHLGVAVAVNILSLGYQRTLWAGFESDPRPLVSAPAEAARHDIDAALQLDGVGVTIRSGLTIVLTRWLQLGFSSEISVASLDGDLALNRCDVAQPNCHPAAFSLNATGGTASMKLHQPALLTFGVAVKPLDRLKLFLAGSYSIAPADPVQAEAHDTLVEASNKKESYELSVLPLGITYRDALSVRAATEIALVRTFLWLRVGWAFHSAAGPPEQPSAVAPALSQHLLGLGFVVRKGRYGLLIGVSHRFAEALDSDGSDATLVNPLDTSDDAIIGAGRYDSQSTAVALELQVTW